MEKIKQFFYLLDTAFFQVRLVFLFHLKSFRSIMFDILHFVDWHLSDTIWTKMLRESHQKTKQNTQEYKITKINCPMDWNNVFLLLLNY
jgi:hypothetical protein